MHQKEWTPIHADTFKDDHVRGTVRHTCLVEDNHLLWTGSDTGFIVVEVHSMWALGNTCSIEGNHSLWALQHTGSIEVSHTLWTLRDTCPIGDKGLLWADSYTFLILVQEGFGWAFGDACLVAGTLGF